MAGRVFVHLGLPKTATTYLQTVLWSSRPLLREQGLLLPGQERRDHLWASRVVREDPQLKRAPERHRTSWDRLRREIAGWSGDALVSHEFFAAASAEQAAAAVAALAPAEVHLVVTARDPLSLFTASWQESLKNRNTEPIEAYARDVSPKPTDIWNWRTLDLRLVLERWAVVPAERVHVLPLDTGAAREEIWHRFGALLGLETEAFDLSGSFPNESMGVVEAETLRRVNAHLGTFRRAFDRGVYIRTYLADGLLATRGGERFWPPADRIEEQRVRARDWVDFVRAGGFDVRGDLEHLLVPESLPDRREPASVTDAEVAEVAVEVVAQMLGEVRELRSARSDAAAQDAGGTVVSALMKWWSLVRRRVLRSSQ